MTEPLANAPEALADLDRDAFIDLLAHAETVAAVLTTAWAMLEDAWPPGGTLTHALEFTAEPTARRVTQLLGEIKWGLEP